MEKFVSRVVVSGVVLAVLFVRHRWPNLLDVTDLILIAFILLPWLSSLVKSMDFPGGWKIEFQDVSNAGSKVTSAAARVSGLRRAKPAGKLASLLPLDSNLALVDLRVQIERRLRDVAEANNMPSSKPLSMLLRSMGEQEILPSEALSGLTDLISLGNKAAHGAKVEPGVATWAAEQGPLVLGVLDSLLEQSGTPEGAG